MGGPLGRRPLGRKFIGLACHAQGGQIPLFCSTGEDERDSERGWVGERERESECVCVCVSACNKVHQLQARLLLLLEVQSAEVTYPVLN